MDMEQLESISNINISFTVPCRLTTDPEHPWNASDWNEFTSSLSRYYNENRSAGYPGVRATECPCGRLRLGPDHLNTFQWTISHSNVQEGIGNSELYHLTMNE